MNFKRASEKIRFLLSGVRSSDREELLLWAKSHINELLEKFNKEDNKTVLLNSIKEDIRESLPVEAVTETETIMCPTTGTNADCDPSTTLHVDAFLYDDDAIDTLCEEGKLCRNYCTKCLSRSVKPLTFISHSASTAQIKFIYEYVLQDLRGKTVLDVGSRTGALLYGCHIYSEAKRIIGVELDPTFCDLQDRIVRKYNFEDRIQVIQGDIQNQAKLLKNSDVIILNNVFEFFMPADEQTRIWKFLYEILRKKDTILVSIPSIEESLSNIQAGLDITSWLQKVDIESCKDSANMRYFDNPEDSDLADIFMYEVI